MRSLILLYLRLCNIKEELDVSKKSLSIKKYLTLIPLSLLWLLIKLGSISSKLLLKIQDLVIKYINFPLLFSFLYETTILRLKKNIILNTKDLQRYNKVSPSHSKQYKVKLSKNHFKSSKKALTLLNIFSRKMLKIFTFSIPLPRLQLPQISLPKISLPFLKLRQHRGRPRKRPLLPYYRYKIGRFLRIIFPTPLRIAILLVTLITSGFFYSIFLVDLAHNLPSPEKLTTSSSPLTTEFYDRNGILLYRLYEGKNRQLIKLEDLPPHVTQATISMEDKNFYVHPGVDLFGILRALGAYIEKRQIQGGSTITQQLIKNTLLTPERTLERKIKEIALAFWAERIFTKDQILQMYFNEVPYGGPAWGIEAAAQTYFGKSAHDLTLAESAYLAGLPASPTTYSPYGVNPELGKSRQKQVLRRMSEDGYISKQEAEQALKEQLKISPPTQAIKAPHFVMYVRNYLAQKYGEKTVSQGGLKVITSLDLILQEMAEKVVTEEIAKLESLDVGNGAAMINDAKTGQILAMVGSKNYWDKDSGNFNVTTASRQPGSSIKPITYATAFKMGYSPGTVLLDAPVAYRNEWEVYAPVNYDGKYHGPVSIRTALGSSYNIPAVKILSIVGIPNMLKTAHDLGITTLNDRDRYGLSLTLGGGEVRLIDMMTVYGTFSQNGTRYDPQPVLKITDGAGNILEDNNAPLGKKVIDDGIAYMISNILSDNKARTPAFGPNSLLIIPGHTVAAKTGTTDSKKDNWTCGYSPEFVSCVWVGNMDNKPMHPQLTSGVTGAAPIWNKIMTNLLKNRPEIAFIKPAEVGERVVNGNKDLVLINQPLAQEKNKTLPPQDTVITFTDPLKPVPITQPVVNP